MAPQMECRTATSPQRAWRHRTTRISDQGDGESDLCFERVAGLAVQTCCRGRPGTLPLRAKPRTADSAGTPSLGQEVAVADLGVPIAAELGRGQAPQLAGGLSGGPKCSITQATPNGWVTDRVTA